MKTRAIIFDVYNTILEVTKPTANPGDRWKVLCRDFFGASENLPLNEFTSRAESLIGSCHAQARSQGINFPEICWPEIVAQVIPAVGALSKERRSDFIFRHAQIQRSIRLMPGVAEILAALKKRELFLGIASNAQAYTLLELESALATAGLTSSLFKDDLCFWSFQAGFSKPDPHVFRLLDCRLKGYDVSSSEVLMVGDRLDNDILPSRQCGWKAWQFGKEDPPSSSSESAWKSLRTILEI